MKSNFTIKLIDWHIHINKRTMPWKGEKDPYKIWLSEIILQQTRVEQGLSYYNKFIEAYPNLSDLAKAPDEEVFKLWEGLGYYSRCKNLLETARFIVTHLNNKFPSSYKEIIQLKGVGPYTAAAISSFAYNLPYAVLDGNVFRVLSRYFANDLPINSTNGKKFFGELAQQLLNKSEPATYNQAIMDFGATVCKPQIPLCQECVLNDTCLAFINGQVNTLPVKEKQLLRKERWLYYFVFTCKDEVLINQRRGRDIWENLYEFYLFEAYKQIEWHEAFIAEWLSSQLGITIYDLKKVSKIHFQLLTHQKIQGQFITVRLKKIPVSLQHLQRVKKYKMDKLAFSGFINQYLKEIPLFRSLL